MERKNNNFTLVRNSFITQYNKNMRDSNWR